MRVLFVYKYLTLGGVETVFRARLDGLSRWGIDARAWFFYDLGGRSIFEGQEDRIGVGDVGCCLRYVRDGDFDLVCSVDTEEIFPGFEASPDLPRLVIECHSPYLENIEYLRHLGGLQPVAILTPSEYQRRTVEERVGDGIDVEVVPNPLRQVFVDEPAPFPTPLPRPVVAWIGRLDELKNWRGFVGLAGLMADRGLPVEFWMAGRAVGMDRGTELIECARKAGVLDRLRWFRGVPHTVVPTLLDAVRDSGGVLVSTSRGESFGMTVAEAMARRCAVVVPNRAPFTEFVEHGASGSCFQADSMEAAADSIEALLADPGLRTAYGERGRRTILERFAPEPALDSLARTLQRLTDLSGCGGSSGRTPGDEVCQVAMA